MTNATTQSHRTVRGLIAGLVAAVPMGALTMMLGLAVGLGFFEPLRLIASALLGEAALDGAFPVLLGLMLHMATGALLGALYARIVRPSASTPAAGIVYGLGVWAAAALVQGAAAPLLAQGLPGWIFALAHAVYGLSLAALLRR
ncbi:hypothetical protein [Oceanithermus sp.]|uniref:hypothetical protein n=1 Tax=Oceanithermus sp. TaxID=2268145 RepID=UPI00257FAAE5|nr:hypothetical protein [Oceanithermus sp.]